ncbi:hypothetical protein H4696_000716 [Amycolatopsis lexingtonensis]|uniref:Uncharacterized protein n=1 Tax=Amycolatopsis lexingtonensis TaxID=218822 RepID=A0ABR9HRS0_9PSEU|nr:hypothetical protein [Amycolatopsis lexingtonensis]MBE1493616.1 hypothetical protein [Amycolatopsis lexingtonensis]
MTKRLRSPARVAITTWHGSTPTSGTVVTSGRRRLNRTPAGTIETSWPAAISGPSGARALGLVADLEAGYYLE